MNPQHIEGTMQTLAPPIGPWGTVRCDVNAKGASGGPQELWDGVGLDLLPGGAAGCAFDRALPESNLMLWESRWRSRSGWAPWAGCSGGDALIS